MNTTRDDWTFLPPLPPPHHTMVRVAVRVRICHVPSGDIHEYEDYCCWVDDDGFGGNGPSLYIWQDGNYSCDCNRHTLFMSTVPGYDGWDVPCGHGQYLVQLANAKTGDVFYDEFSGGPVTG